jgi:hypothetical protein
VVQGHGEARGVQREAVEVRASKLGQNPLFKLGMGSYLYYAHKVFDKMAEKTLFLNFAKIFGGLQSYINRSRMEVVVVKMVQFCEITKWVESRICFNVTTLLDHNKKWRKN